MSSVNFGNQTVLWNYGTEYKSLIFGRLLDSLNIEGVVSGLNITITGDTSITISEGVVIIKNIDSKYSTNPVVSKVHFDSSILLSLTKLTNYIGLRYNYSLTEESYCEVILAGAEEDFEINDIILGKINWSGGVISSIGNKLIKYSVFKDLDKKVNKIKFTIETGISGYDDTISLTEDVYLMYTSVTNCKYIKISSTIGGIIIPHISGSTTRVDLISYDISGGALHLTEGITTSFMLANASYIPLLLIKRTGPRNDVTTDDFIYIN